MPGGWASLPATDKLELAEIAEAFPIDCAEARASQKQLDFQQAFITRRDKTGRKVSIFVALGGNRAGKSFVCGLLGLGRYLEQFTTARDRFWLISQNLERSVTGQQRELWENLPRRLIVDGQQWDEKIGFGQHRKLILWSADSMNLPKAQRGNMKVTIEFRSADQDPSTFEQAALTGVWIDERCPEVIYDRLIPRLVDRDGWILYSDIPEQWWQYERLKEAMPEAGVYYQHFEMADNEQNLPAGAIDEAAARMTEEQRALRIRGEFVVMEGVVYREYFDAIRPNGHLVKPFRVPAAWPRWRAIDYGASSPTACLWFALGPDETIFVYREYYQAGSSIPHHAKAIKNASEGEKYIRTLIDPAAFAASPANPITVAGQYQKEGMPCFPWPRAQEMGLHAMVQRVKQRLEVKRIEVFENCVNLRREFRSWKYKADKDGKPLASDAFEAGNDHALDCLRGFICTNPTFAQVGKRFNFDGTEIDERNED